MIGAGLSAPTDSVGGIVAATVSPAIAYEIGQQFKANGTEGSAGHLLAHAVLGAAVAAAGGNNAMTGAIAAAGSEAIIPVVSQWLYGTKDPEQLTADQKDTLSSIASLVGAGTGALVGDGVADVVSGSQIGQTVVDNNFVAIPITPILPILPTNTQPNFSIAKAGDEIVGFVVGAGEGAKLLFTHPSEAWDNFKENVFGIEKQKANKDKQSNTAKNNVSNASGGSAMPPDPDDKEYKNYKGKLSKGDKIDLGKFTERVKKSGSKAEFKDPKTGWKISSEVSNNPHGGSEWKLYNSQGKRVGTISQNGTFLRE